MTTSGVPFGMTLRPTRSRLSRRTPYSRDRLPPFETETRATILEDHPLLPECNTLTMHNSVCRALLVASKTLKDFWHFVERGDIRRRKWPVGKRSSAKPPPSADAVRRDVPQPWRTCRPRPRRRRLPGRPQKSG
ncbi:hypothetical protein USA:Philadelphia,PA_000010 [unidentified adenovirus]|nr:hypothetical protein USA:Philadelphia,PA_000010 [unidentified adenovirus]